jgi:hypothetical protein
MGTFGAVFLAALALATAMRLWLAARHVSHIRAHRDSVPGAFAAEIGLDSHRKAADYTCAKTRLAMAGVAFDAAVLLALTFGGALQWLHEASAAWLPEGIGRGLLLLAMVAALMTLLDVPFGLYRTFVIENRFGFNKMTPALYFLDFAKSIALAAAFGLPLAAIVLWLMERAGEYWWFYAWLTWTAFNLFMVAVYPTWIAPLFNRFSPLQDAELKARVEALMARCGFKVKGLMVMDGSRRSSHGNAPQPGRGRGGPGARTGPFPAAARGEADGVAVRREPCFSVAPGVDHAAALVLRRAQRAGAVHRHGADPVRGRAAPIHAPAAAARRDVLAQARIRGRPVRLEARLGARPRLGAHQALPRQRRDAHAGSRALGVL